MSNIEVAWCTGDRSTCRPAAWKNLAGHILQAEKHLEDRVVAEISLRLKFLDQLFERNLLVRITFECNTLHARQ